MTSEKLKLTKTQRDFLTLLASGKVAKHERIEKSFLGFEYDYVLSIQHRVFDYNTLRQLVSHELVRRETPEWEYPGIFSITPRGRKLLAGTIEITRRLTQRMKEVMTELDSGTPALAANDGLYYQGDAAVQPETIGALRKFGYLEKLFPDRDLRAAGNGYTLSPKGRTAIKAILDESKKTTGADWLPPKTPAKRRRG